MLELRRNMKQYKGIDITKINLTTRDIMRETCKTHRDATYLAYVPYKSDDTFGQFEEKVNKISNLLTDEYGVKQGNKVGTMSENFALLDVYCNVSFS